MIRVPGFQGRDSDSRCSAEPGIADRLRPRASVGLGQPGPLQEANRSRRGGSPPRGGHPHAVSGTAAAAGSLRRAGSLGRLPSAAPRLTGLGRHGAPRADGAVRAQARTPTKPARGHPRRKPPVARAPPRILVGRFSESPSPPSESALRRRAGPRRLRGRGALAGSNRFRAGYQTLVCRCARGRTSRSLSWRTSGGMRRGKTARLSAPV